jgi:hypothetical protein
VLIVNGLRAFFVVSVHSKELTAAGDPENVTENVDSWRMKGKTPARMLAVPDAGHSVSQDVLYARGNCLSREK